MSKIYISKELLYFWFIVCCMLLDLDFIFVYLVSDYLVYNYVCKCTCWPYNFYH